LVVSKVGKICFVSEFILHTAYNVDACALTSIMPSLSFIDMIYFTVDTKRRRRLFRASPTLLWNAFIIELRDYFVLLVG
jgi:hypothetical protein